jgi:hypothetical protein
VVPAARSPVLDAWLWKVAKAAKAAKNAKATRGRRDEDREGSLVS